MRLRSRPAADQTRAGPVINEVHGEVNELKWHEFLTGPLFAAGGVVGVIITNSAVVMTGPALWWLA